MFLSLVWVTKYFTFTFTFTCLCWKISTKCTILYLCAVDYRKDKTLLVGAESHRTTNCSDYTWLWVSWEGDDQISYIQSWIVAEDYATVNSEIVFSLNSERGLQQYYSPTPQALRYLRYENINAQMLTLLLYKLDWRYIWSVIGFIVQTNWRVWRWNQVWNVWWTVMMNNLLFDHPV